MVKIYADGAKLAQIESLHPHVAGFTFNPTLMKNAGITNMRDFASYVTNMTDKPVSLEVTADDFGTMILQAEKIASWGSNIYVKIPVTNTQGELTLPVIKKLSTVGIKLNVTAIMTHDQIAHAARSLYPRTPSIMSIFAGRIADTGRNPEPYFITAQRVKPPLCQTLWASTREVYNAKQAEGIADIITMSPEHIAKLGLFGRDLAQYSLETVRQFHEDGKGMTI